jgi:hypothetical protein
VRKREVTNTNIYSQQQKPTNRPNNNNTAENRGTKRRKGKNKKTAKPGKRNREQQRLK